jgi:hypothetical protein
MARRHVAIGRGKHDARDAGVGDTANGSSSLKARLQQLRFVYTYTYPIVRDVARAERLVEERKAELRRNP